MAHYPNPALEAELAYRQELVRSTARREGGRRGSWLGRRRAH
jgi:hypothetical protein